MSGMTDEQRIWELVQEVLDTNKLPEEVCADCPELLSEVQRRWKQARHVNSQLEALFPSTDSASPQAATERRQFLVDGQLPTVPGYEVDEVLGHGGMGVVYKARHVKLNRPVALKMMLYGADATSSEQARFQREAEAVAALHDPHIVQIYDVGEADGRPYYTMEFLEGGSLAKRLAGKPQPAAAAASYSLTLAEAVQAAHNAGIVHRDLKPANVLLTSDGMLKISDFGLARRLDVDQSLTLTAANVGTPSYMAPEQALGRANAFSHAVDIYALGAMLYEMLTGRPPFRAETAAETQRQLIAEEPVPPSRLNTNVPRDLETICLKCLHKEPERRYASAETLADDLRRFAEGRPIHARPVGWAERSWRWSRRNPAAAALLVTALALVGLASGGGVWLVHQQAERRAEAIQRDRELRNEVTTAVAQSVVLRKGFHFKEARELLEQARQRLEPAGPDELRRLVDQRRADLDLVERLDTVRFPAARAVILDPAAESHYVSIFAEAGLGRVGDDSESVAARVRTSPVQAEIVAALDDWASITPDKGRMKWLLDVARLVDPDPTRDRLRQPDLWQDGAKLTKLAQEFESAELSPQLATALGRVARLHDGDALPLVTAARARFPQDFWVNFELGITLSRAKRWDDAVACYRAALALRPTASPVHSALGDVLLALKRVQAAMGEFQEAIRLDPGNLLARFNLGGVLSAQGRLDEAVSCFREVIRLRPDPKTTAVAHNNIGVILRNQGRLEEAFKEMQEAVRIDPNLIVARENLGKDLYAAACATVLAGAGQSADNEAAGEQERAGQRRRALDWLRADIELTKRIQKDGKAPGWSLTVWQTDPALASVREPAELAKLPNAEREQWQRLWTDVAAAIADNPLEQSRGNAARGKWSRAAADYARCLKRGPTDDGNFWFEYAAVSLLAGDRRSYDKLCEHMIDACGKVEGLRPYHVARACTLAPNAAGDTELPIGLIENELQGNAQQFWSLTEQGALAYRAEQFQVTAGFAQQSLQADSKPGRAVVNWLWLALANHRLGKPEEARRWLGKAQKWLDQFGDGMPPRAEEELGLHLHNWLEAQVLRREAEALVLPH